MLGHERRDSLDVGGERVLWKIDYFDRALTNHSPDPTDPAVTTRVLTIMLAVGHAVANRAAKENADRLPPTLISFDNLGRSISANPSATARATQQQAFAQGSSTRAGPNRLARSPFRTTTGTTA